MAHRPRSLKHEYELYVEREIENYKDSVPRNALLKIGDEAVATLEGASQLALTELLLCEEVDRLIRRRLRLPTYQTWRRRRIKELEELRRPEHWGLRADDPVVRTLRPPADGHVLIAGLGTEGSALYLAAHGCDVTALADAPDVVERVLLAAEAAGLLERVHACVADFGSWRGTAASDEPFSAVVCDAPAFAGLTASQRARVIESLQGATAAGGVHILGTAGNGRARVSLRELHARYRGWVVSVEGGEESGVFMAKKDVA